MINGSPMAQMAQAIRRAMEHPAPPRCRATCPAHPPAKLELVRSVFRLHPEVTSATLFGSRAKGTHTHPSDVDLVVAGDIGPLRAEAIAAELEEMPLPYRFDVQSLAHIQHRPLLEHIKRVGILNYPAP